MDKFKRIETSIKDLYIIEPKVHMDKRGYFMETYSKVEFEKIGLYMDFVQDNESKSTKGVLRGLHFQTKYPQGKLVRVSSGKVYDVAVDLRADSDTYGKWEGVILSCDNKRQFYIPEGFAHGFIVLSDTAILNYKCTNYYYPEYDSGIMWDDKDLDVKWPVEDINKLIISDKDKKQQSFKEFKKINTF